MNHSTTELEKLLEERRMDHHVMNLEGMQEALDLVKELSKDAPELFAEVDKLDIAEAVLSSDLDLADKSMKDIITEYLDPLYEWIK